MMSGVELGSLGATAALLAVAGDADPRFCAALVLADETGHRQQAICQLRWSDIDLGREEITWRGATDKRDSTHHTPLTRDAIEAVLTLRRQQAVIGDGWGVPGTAQPGQAL